MVLVGLGVALYINNFGPAQEYTGPVETLRVGSVSEFSLLLLAADRHGYFRENGLDIKLKEYATGAAAFKGLQDKEVDISAASDFVGVRGSFSTQDFRIITSIFHTPELFRLVARKDRAIQKPGDIQGKRVGLTKNTAGEFFLSTLLTFNNLSMKDVTPVYGEPPELTKLILDGKVDAVISARYHTHQIDQALGGGGAVFPAQSNTFAYQLLYAQHSLAEQQPDTLRRFLQALVQAENYLNSHPDEVRLLLADKFKRPDEYITGVLPQFHFTLSLNQSMILAMEDEARWVMSTRPAQTMKLPNYLDFTYFDGLEKVKPEAITIIR